MTVSIVTILGTIVAIAVLSGIAKLVYSLTDNGKNVERMRKMGLFLCLGILVISGVGCDGSDNDATATSTPQVVTGIEQADSLIEDAQDGTNDVKSALCKACLIGELLGGDDCNCNVACGTELVCQDEGDD